jgi:menaquinone-9 beta-reductase
MRLKPIRIVGGGLAGLALGRRLAQAGAPVILHDTGRYPRHRVCGEFIAGLDDETVTALQLAPALAGSLRHETVAWWTDQRQVAATRLPEPAIGLSRWAFDQRMSSDLADAGGELRLGQRFEGDLAAEGVVAATGRRPGRSPWIGLKAHFRGLETSGDLEFHLGRGAYVGLCAVEDGSINVCGLFRAGQGRGADRPNLVAAAAEAAGLGRLAGRLRRAELVEGSVCAVAGLDFRVSRGPTSGLRLGDAYGAIPPFTGAGMTLALRSAALAYSPLLTYSQGELSWSAAVAMVSKRLGRRLAPPLRAAAMVHPLLARPGFQPWLARAAAWRLLPIGLLYRLLR